MSRSSHRHNKPRHRHQRRRSHLVPILAGGLLATAAVVLVGYLLWPTWHRDTLAKPDRIPVNVGNTFFNVPAHAFRRKVQKNSGPQESVELSYNYPSLAAPEAPRHVSAEKFDPNAQPIDRIFLTITAHHDIMSPDIRFSTIYPRYTNDTAATEQDGLITRPFRDGSPYEGEDLFVAAAPALVARCTRDGDTPGMCLSERRIGGADLTYRFPLKWLAQWRDIAGAMDNLAAHLSSPHG